LSEKKITLKKLQMLRTIDEIANKTGLGMTPIEDLINILAPQRCVRAMAIRKMVWQLNKEGYIENPIRGCWRLTEKGKKVLEEVSAEGVV